MRSLKSVRIPSFILIGCCVIELHGHLCPYCNVWPEAVYCCFTRTTLLTKILISVYHMRLAIYTCVNGEGLEPRLSPSRYMTQPFGIPILSPVLFMHVGDPYIPLFKFLIYL